MGKYSDDELSGLTEAEREALGDDLDDGEDVDTGETGDEAPNDGTETGADDDSAGDKESSDGTKDAEADVAAADAAAEASAKDDAATKAAEAPPAERTDFIPKLSTGEKRDFKIEVDDLNKKFEDGEISQSELTSGIVKIASEQAEANVSAKYNAEMETQKWLWESQRFEKEHPEYKSAVMRGAFNAALESLETDPKTRNMDNGDILAEADRRVKSEFGLKLTPPDDKAQDKPTSTMRPVPKPGEAEAKASKLAPKTLGDLPAADDTGTGEDRFSHIDKLVGIDRERALAKLSEADTDAYLAGR